ncbi:MAG: tetratricopeptide repeat protein, partial [Caldilineaceae bacterium]|nr:tetratricopeptide repeat protein [Caldilineaceae bacterium]
VAVTQSSLALVMLARGEYGEAERLFKQALETMRQVRACTALRQFRCSGAL